MRKDLEKADSKLILKIYDSKVVQWFYQLGVKKKMSDFFTQGYL